MLVEERPYGRPVGAGREKQSMGARRTRTRAVVGVAPAVPSVIHRLDGPVERPGQPFAALADGRGISQGHQDLHGCAEAVHVAGKSRKLVCGGGSEPEKALTLSPNCTRYQRRKRPPQKSHHRDTGRDHFPHALYVTVSPQDESSCRDGGSRPSRLGKKT